MMKTAKEWEQEGHGHLYSAQVLVEKVREEFRKAVIGAIEKKFGPYASENYSRWNDALRCAISAIEKL